MAVARVFEDLQMYQSARELTRLVYSFSRTKAFRGDYALVDQIRRASISIMANIAEGFERGSKTEFIQFLYIAKGSCGEVRAHLQIAVDQSYIDDVAYAEARERCSHLSGMISRFIAHQQKSEYRGEKYNQKKPTAQGRTPKPK